MEISKEDQLVSQKLRIKFQLFDVEWKLQLISNYKEIPIIFREIINGILVLLHFIFGTPVFFRLSRVPPTYHANYNRDTI